jgi:porin-like protein
MLKSLLVIVAVVLPASAALAEQPRIPRSDKAASTGKVMPLKGARSANSCAEYGAGFVKIEGTNTCMKIGGVISIGAGVSGGSR